VDALEFVMQKGGPFNYFGSRKFFLFPDVCVFEKIP